MVQNNEKTAEVLKAERIVEQAKSKTGRSQEKGKPAEAKRGKSA